MSIFINENNLHSDQLVRAIQLEDGLIFEVTGINIQYDKNNFYEVEFDGYDEYMQSLWSRTGRQFTVEEINNMAKWNMNFKEEL